MKPGESRILGGRINRCRPSTVRDLGAGAMFQETVEQQLHAEIVHWRCRRTPACSLPASTCGIIENFTRVFEHLRVLRRLLLYMSWCIKLPAHRLRIVHDRRRKPARDICPPTVRSNKMHLAWSGDRTHRENQTRRRAGQFTGNAPNAEHALQFIQRVQADRFIGRSQLVHEREDRHATLATDLEQLARLTARCPWPRINRPSPTESTAVSTR